MGLVKRLLLVFLFFVAVFSVLQFSVAELIGQDAWLHAGMAKIIAEEGFVQVFPYTTESILAAEYADLQWGYRTLLVPFLAFGAVTGVKLASVVFGSLFFSVLYWYFSKRNLEYAFFWTVVASVVSGELMYRFMLGRALPIALTLLVLTLYALEEKKYKLLLVFSLLAAWLYPGFVVQASIVVLFFVFYRQKIDVLTYGLGGSVLGMVTSPYVPKNLSLLWTQIVQVNLLGNAYNLEWKAWDLGQFISINAVVLVVFGIGITIALKKRSIGRRPLLFLVLASLFFIFMIKTRRMHEFFVPFVVLFSAFVLSRISFRSSHRYVVVGVVVVLGMFQMSGVHSEISRNHFFPWYADSVEWMQQNVEAGARVFNNGYAFSYLFFYLPELQYTHGVDLTYAELYNTERFKRYIGVLQGQNPGFNIIIEDYDVDYIFVGKIKQDVQLFNHIIAYGDDFKLVYEDESAAVLKVFS